MFVFRIIGVIPAAQRFLMKKFATPKAGARDAANYFFPTSLNVRILVWVFVVSQTSVLIRGDGCRSMIFFANPQVHLSPVALLDQLHNPADSRPKDQGKVCLQHGTSRILGPHDVCVAL